MAKEKEIKTEGAAQEVQSTGNEGGGNAAGATAPTTTTDETGSKGVENPSEGAKPADEGSATTLSARDAYRQRIKEDNPELDIDSVACNLADMLEDMMEIEEVEVEYE